MNATTRWRGLTTVGRTVAVFATLFAVQSFVPAANAAPTPSAGGFTDTATQTAEQTVTVDETTVIEGYTGYGTATKTATATVTRTETYPTEWEAYYWATFNAWWEASMQAYTEAESQARTAAKTIATADAQAQVDEAKKPKTHTSTQTAEQTVTVDETTVIEGYTGYGTATKTASATVTRTETYPTEWEAYYWATFNAWWDASMQAYTDAESQARAAAKDIATADAQAQVDEAKKPKTYTATHTAEQTATVTETVVIEGYTGYGTAEATASASATRTETYPTEWEAYYWATFNAWWDAVQSAIKAAEDLARPIAIERAEADARAQIEEAAKPKEYTATVTVEQTQKVNESWEIGDIVGRGTATVTKSATVTYTATAPTEWEAKYWAETTATEQATKQARDEAHAQASAEALELAKIDAQAQVDAEAEGGGGATSDACGPEVLKEDGTAWDCTFVDDFRGTSLNRSIWGPQLTANSGFQHAGECFVDSPDTIAVANGSLRLSTIRRDEPFTCENPGGDYESNYVAGQVSSMGTFAQAFGRFEFRAKMTNVSTKGLHAALWLWPQDESIYGGRPHSGEIDIAEIFTLFPDRAVPMLHYDAPLGNKEDGTGRTNEHCLLNPTEWNTYTAEWTTTGITISYNGQPCLTHEWNADAPLTGAQPFDQPFFLVMTQTIGNSGNAIDPENPPPGTTLAVDYVRVWS